MPANKATLPRSFSKMGSTLGMMPFRSVCVIGFTNAVSVDGSVGKYASPTTHSIDYFILIWKTLL